MRGEDDALALAPGVNDALALAPGDSDADGWLLADSDAETPAVELGEGAADTEGDCVAGTDGWLVGVLLAVVPTVSDGVLVAVLVGVGGGVARLQPKFIFSVLGTLVSVTPPVHGSAGGASTYQLQTPLVLAPEAEKQTLRTSAA